MRGIFVAAIGVLFSVAAQAQNDSTNVTIDSVITTVDSVRIDNMQTKTRSKKPIMATNMPRSNDHFMLQLGYTGWTGAPDSIKTGGIPRTFNAYVMMDFPFKTNPHWSVALGLGIAADNVYFEKSAVDITGTTTNLAFRNLTDTSHFKKYKLATSYAEVPLELRFSTKPDDSRRSVKFAVGAKVGMLLNAHTKGNTLENKAGTTLNDYKEKLFSKQYFNKQRLSGTARIGFGHFTLFGSYALTPLFKEGVAPVIRPYTVGVTLSGL
jgi:hypothetical protein